MKILVFNGSPKGERSDTLYITRAFLAGMQSAGQQEVKMITAVEQHEEYCTGCFACMNNGGTWKDYFLDLAEQQMIQVQALCDYAEENGISLTEEELAASDEAVKQNESYVTLMGYGSVDAFVQQ